MENIMKPGYFKGELRPCPCGGRAVLVDEGVNKTGHEGVRFGRVICDENDKFAKPSERCYMKTVAGPMKEAVRSWNNRPAFDKAIDALIAKISMRFTDPTPMEEVSALTGLTFNEALEIYKKRQEAGE